MPRRLGSGESGRRIVNVRAAAAPPPLPIKWGALARPPHSSSSFAFCLQHSPFCFCAGLFLLLVRPRLSLAVMASAHNLAREVAQLRRELVAREEELAVKDEALAERDASLSELCTCGLSMLTRLE